MQVSQRAQPPRRRSRKRCRIRWRMASSFPEDPRHDLRRGRADRKRVSRADRRQVRDPRVRGRRDRAAAAGARRGAERHRRVRPDGGYYYFGKDPAFAFDTALPFGLNAASRTPGWTTAAAWTDARIFTAYNIINFPVATPAPRWAAGIRKEIKSVADLKGLKLRVAGLGRPDPRAAGRRAAADRRRRHLSGARKGHDRRGRMGRSCTTTRSSASTRSRSTTTTRAGGKAGRSSRST